MNREEFIQINSKNVDTSPQNFNVNESNTNDIKEDDIILKKKGIELKKKKGERRSQSKKLTTICNICWDPLKEEINLKCKHSFCRECLIEYFMSCSNIYKIVNITCPQEGCKKRFPYSEIINILMKNDNNNKLLKKYLNVLKEFHIIADGELLICSAKDCGSYAYKSKNDLVKCHFNGHYFCQRCGQNEVNHKLKCEIEIIKEKVNSKIIVCEECSFINPVRSEDRVYFECVNCNNIKCYLCDRKDKNLRQHYSTSFSLCFSMRNIKRTSLLAQSKVYRFLYILICLPIIMIIFAIFILTFSSFIIIASASFNKSTSKLTNFNHLIFSFIRVFYTLFLGIALYPTLFLFSIIGLIVMTVLSIPNLLKNLFKSLYNNEKIGAEGELQEEESSNIIINKNRNIEKIDSLLSKL